MTHRQLNALNSLPRMRTRPVVRTTLLQRRWYYALGFPTVQHHFNDVNLCTESEFGHGYAG